MCEESTTYFHIIDSSYRTCNFLNYVLFACSFSFRYLLVLFYFLQLLFPIEWVSPSLATHNEARLWTTITIHPADRSDFVERAVQK
jgi:hypothetical protein